MSDASDLYGLPLHEFIPERTALAKALRKDGQREEAARVSKLRRPSVAAWTVNQLVRTQKRDVTALFKAGDALQKAQSDLLEGSGDAATLRESATRQRGAVSDLVDKARGLLSDGGQELSDATIDRVSATLEAAALDDEARAHVQPGCLERELQHAGLGLLGGGPSAPAEPRARSKPTQRADKQASGDTRAEQKHPARERAESLRSARRTEASARRAAERATRELDRARARWDEATQELEDAEAALAEATKAAERATNEHRRAEQELQKVV